MCERERETYTHTYRERQRDRETERKREREKVKVRMNLNRGPKEDQTSAHRSVKVLKIIDSSISFKPQPSEVVKLSYRHVLEEINSWSEREREIERQTKKHINRRTYDRER